MSAQEMLIEEIKRQPEPVAREVLHYLKFIERQRAQEDWADVLPSREVEQEKLTSSSRTPGTNLGPPRKWTMTSFSRGDVVVVV